MGIHVPAIRLLFLCLFLNFGPAWAANYALPGNLPATCVANAGNFNCVGLTLAWNDTLTIGSPTTLTVKGKFDAQNGQINVAGNVADLSVVVTGDFVCDQCQLQGNLSVGGKTQLIYKGVIGGSITGASDVKLGTSSQVGGDVSAAGRAVTVESYVRVLGNLTVGSLSDTGTSTYYGGSITATTGSVTLSNLSVVAGNVTVDDKDETVTLNSAQATVNGCVTVNSNKNGAITLGWQAGVGGVCCSPGNSGCKDSCVANNSGGSMPPLCTAGTGSAADGFSAIDNAYSATLANFQTGHIYTKLVGVAFPLKIAALYNNQIQTGYAGSGNKTVTVKLVDNSDGLCGTDATRKTACASSACTGKSAAGGGSQTLTFAAGDKGIKTSGDFTVAAAYANLVAVISDGSVTACSVDSFAVRPTLVSAVASSATNSGSSGTPVFKAGTDAFTLTATVNAGNYNGTLKIDTTAMSANGPGWKVGALTPAAFGSATGGTSTSVATGSFKYDEVGNFRFLGYDPAANTTSARGLYDDSWTAVDAAKSDCVAGSYANTLNGGGQYGCLFGLQDGGAAAPDSALFGRFVPDHFSYLGGGVTPFCTGGSKPFTYMGQAALRIAYRLAAHNGSGGVTTNYSEALGYPVANPSLVAEDQATGNQGCDLASRLGGLATAKWVGGLFTLNDADADNVPDTDAASPAATFSRPAAPVALNSCAADRASAGGPFLLLDLGVALNDPDAALAGLDMNAATSGVCSGAGCTARKIASTAVVDGRLWLNNAYGSEMLPLAVPIHAQYWSSAGWQKNAYDSCTPLTQPTRQDTGNGGLNFYAAVAGRNALAAGDVVAQMGGSTASSVALQAGDARLVLRHPTNAAQGPGAGKAGYVDVIGGKLGTGSWLPPTGNARACFGACGPRSPVIYLRESF